jgi:hypothetical protein
MSDNLKARIDAKAAQIRAEDEKAKKEAFTRMMQNPLVRLTISSLPPSDGQLEVLLEAFFNTGFDNGSVTTIKMVAESFMKDGR